MRNFISQKVQDLKPSGIRKFFDLASQIEGCISLGVGEPDFDTPWHIREEGIYALEKGKTYYTSNAGLKELREEISKYIYKSLNLAYDWQDSILVTIGGSEAIDVALRTILEPFDEVIIPTPCYVSYEPCVRLAGGVVKTISLKKENDFCLTAQELEQAITPRSKAIILNYPNNPTGAVMGKLELEAIAKVIIKHDLLVISDEIYSELSYFNKHISIACIENMKERTILINGFSKAFSMTGWRLGYVCAPASIIKQMTKIHQFCIMCAPIMSQYAAIEALKNGEQDVVQMKESYDERRRYVVDRLCKMGLECFNPKGAFYVFPSIKKFGMSSEEFAIKLLKEEKVIVVPGSAFGESGEGYIRISYAYSIENLKKALNKIENFISKKLTC